MNITREIMLLKLTNISGISAIQQNLSHNVYGLSELQFEDQHVGKGAVGEVYKVISIDGNTFKDLLIKIVRETELSEKAYETISILHDKLNTHQRKTGIPIFIEIPELNGLPFLAFRASIDGKEQRVTCLLMKDLTAFDYSDLGSESWSKENFIKEVGFEEKLYLCYQFARGVTFLHELNFIHADLKDVSIFVNLSRPQLAIIDYDGGYHYDKQGFAITLGAINAWMSDKWRKIFGQGKSAKDVTTNERLAEENWIIANGLFELLFGIPPFYFLTSLEGNNIERYLSNNKWPYIENASELINPSNVGNHGVIIKMIETLSQEGLKPLIDAFRNVFNEGSRNEAVRLKPKDWKKLLFDLGGTLIGSPQIEEFKADKLEIFEARERVSFKWKANFFRVVYLNDSIQDPLRDFNDLEIPDTTVVTLKVENDFGIVTSELLVSARKVEPKIISFNTNIQKRGDLSPVILSWTTEECKHVTIDFVSGQLPSIGSIEIDPIQKTVIRLIAVGFFGQEVSAELVVDVEEACVNTFNYEINIEKGIDNIDLFWQTTNANEIEISPNIGKVSPSGSISVGISEKTVFTIVARGYFNIVEKTIEAQPFPIPIIKGIFVPTPTLILNSNIPSELLKVPDSLNIPVNIQMDNKINFQLSPPALVQLEKNDSIRETSKHNKVESKRERNDLEYLFNKIKKFASKYEKRS